MKNYSGFVAVQVRKFEDYHPRTDEMLYNQWKFLTLNPRFGIFKPNLLTNGGRDGLHARGYIDTSALKRGFGYIALTESTITPAATDTTLSGEITTGGLARADAQTKTHTSGTNTSTIEHTFTATSAFSTGVKATGLFDAVSSGVLSHITTFTNQTLSINDQIRITYLITLG